MSGQNLRAQPQLYRSVKPAMLNHGQLAGRALPLLPPAIRRPLLQAFLLRSAIMEPHLRYRRRTAQVALAQLQAG